MLKNVLALSEKICYSIRVDNKHIEQKGCIMKNFEVGHFYECGDSGFDPIKVLRRTAKTITVTTNGVHIWRMRVRIDSDGNEYVQDCKVPKSYMDIGVGMYSTKWETT